MGVVASGQQGDMVLAVQSLLESANFPAGKLDGDFGPKTRFAVEAFQQSVGLPADGVVGPETREVLEKAATAGDRFVLLRANPFDSRQPRLLPCMPEHELKP